MAVPSSFGGTASVVYRGVNGFSCALADQVTATSAPTTFVPCYSGGGRTSICDWEWSYLYPPYSKAPCIMSNQTLVGRVESGARYRHGHIGRIGPATFCAAAVSLVAVFFWQIFFTMPHLPTFSADTLSYIQKEPQRTVAVYYLSQLMLSISNNLYPVAAVQGFFLGAMSTAGLFCSTSNGFRLVSIGRIDRMSIQSKPCRFDPGPRLGLTLFDRLSGPLGGGVASFEESFADAHRAVFVVCICCLNGAISGSGNSVANGIRLRASALGYAASSASRHCRRLSRRLRHHRNNRIFQLWVLGSTSPVWFCIDMQCSVHRRRIMCRRKFLTRTSSLRRPLERALNLKRPPHGKENSN